MTSWTAADLPSFAGRSVIVTGANSGLGAVTARELARVGADVTLAVRDVAKGRAAAAAMPGHNGEVAVRALDLADLSSVRRFAEETPSVDVLINNAGIMAVPYAKTADGFESQIGTNHLGHFALTNLLLPKLTDRVVTVSSFVHRMGRVNLKDLNWESRRYRPWLAYGQSKLANLLFTSELQRRLVAAGSTVRALAAHPGYSNTNLQGQTGNRIGDMLTRTIGNGLLATSPDFGARQTLYAASQDLSGNTFVGPRFGLVGRTGSAGRSLLAKRGATAAGLWELSERLTGVEFPL